MTKFPTMIEWIEDVGMSSLREQYDEYNNEEGVDPLTFSQYVESSYEGAVDVWQGEMFHRPRDMKIDFNEDGEIDSELAKQVFVTIVNEGIEEHRVGNIVLEYDMSPDPMSATMIVHTFWEKILPAVEDALKNLA